MERSEQFVKEWQALCRTHGLKQVDFVRQAGMPPSHVHRLWKGEYAPSPEDFKKIVSVTCKTEEEKARLVQARLLDYCDRHDRHLIKISLRSGRDQTPKVFMSLQPEVQESLIYLAGQALDNPQMGTSLVHLAKAWETTHIRKKKDSA